MHFALTLGPALRNRVHSNQLPNTVSPTLSPTLNAATAVAKVRSLASSDWRYGAREGTIIEYDSPPANAAMHRR